jgi:hypothetical protein
MYLAEVWPKRKNFRLWKCPECNSRSQPKGFCRKTWPKKLEQH